MTRSLHVALLQLAAHDRSEFSLRWPKILETIIDASASGAKLVVLPEGTIPSYMLGTQAVDRKMLRDAILDLERLAERFQNVIVCGGAHPGGGDPESLENAALVITSQGLVAAVGKRFLWHFDDRWFVPGKTLQVVATPVGKLGLLVCADGRLPTLARELVDRGAEILVVSTAWVTSGRNPRALENPLADFIARTRAWENGVPLVVANKVGTELRSVLYCGKSQVVAADGTLLALASEHAPETMHVGITLATPRPKRHSAQHEAAQPQRISTEKKALRVGFCNLIDAELQTTAEWSSVNILLAHDDARSTPHPKTACIVSTIPAGTKASDDAPHMLVVDDAWISDPGSMPPFRECGYDFFVWRSLLYDDDRRLLLARTRALELRSYVVCITSAVRKRSFAVDPEGVVIAGTTDHLALAQFVYDPHRTSTTTIAPGTDILAGLCYIRALQESP